MNKTCVCGLDIENSSSGYLAENPSSARLDEKTSSGYLAENHSSARLAENHSSARLDENPSSGYLAENLSSTRLGENSSSVQLVENYYSKYSNESNELVDEAKRKFNGILELSLSPSTKKSHDRTYANVIPNLFRNLIPQPFGR